jgi:ubiquitin carboxyl-terminal hydrolase 34
MSNAEESIQDHNDFLYNLGRTKVIYAVPRFNTKHQRKSVLMVQLMQTFGEQGGFQLFYSRISDPTRYCPIESLHQIMQILG